MIARIWHGRVKTEKSKEYLQFLHKRAVPDYLSVPGIREVRILDRMEGPVTHILTMTYWDSYDAIRGFAGEDTEKAKYYPEDKDFLLEFEPHVLHYTISGPFNPDA